MNVYGPSNLPNSQCVLGILAHLVLAYPVLACSAMASALASLSTAQNDAIVSEENCILLDRVQAIADQLWRECAVEVAGAEPARAIRLHSVVNSHPEFLVFSTAPACMPSLANGPPRLCHALHDRVHYVNG